MSEKTTGIYKIFSNSVLYNLTQKIMSGESTRIALVKNVIPKNSKVLDIGCGTAKIIESLPQVDYYGYDISKKHIDYAKRKYSSKKNNFYCKEFNAGEISKLPKFDFVLLFGIIHHVEDDQLRKIFFVLKKTLKKSGKILTLDPVYIKKQNFIAKFLNNTDVGNHVRFKNEYLKILRKDFKKIKSKIKKQTFVPYTWFSTQCQK